MFMYKVGEKTEFCWDKAQVQRLHVWLTTKYVVWSYSFWTGFFSP